MGRELVEKAKKAYSFFKSATVARIFNLLILKK